MCTAPDDVCGVMMCVGSEVRGYLSVTVYQTFLLNFIKFYLFV